MVDRPPLDPGGARWVTAMTATGPVSVRAVRFAGADLIVAGEFDGTLAIGEVRARSRGGRDAFVARLDRRGAPMWVKTFGGPGADRIDAVSVAPAGEIAIGGELGSRLELAGKTLTGPDGFVGILDANGEPRWAAALGATRYGAVSSVAFTGGGDVLAAGHFAGSIAQRDREIHSAGNQDAFVARYARTGEARWIRRAGGPGADLASAVVAGAGGEIVIAGSMMDGAAFEASEHETVGADPDAFVARLDQGGKLIWIRQLGGAGADSAAALAIDGETIVCAGRFSRELTGVTPPLAAAGSTDGFVAWLSLSGQPLRATTAGGERGDGIAAVAFGDGVVIGGSFVDRAGGDLQSAGGLDGLVAKLAGTQPRWRRPLGGSGDDAVNAVDVGPGGEVAAALSFTGALRIDGKRLDGGDQPAGAVVVLEP